MYIQEMKPQTLLFHIRTFANAPSPAEQYLTNIKVPRLLLWPQSGQNGLTHTAECASPDQRATVLPQSGPILIGPAHHRAQVVPVVTSYVL
jgi:hypothetical protein